MITLDTNVLVRLLVEDDPEQTERAQNTLRKLVMREERCDRSARRRLGRGLSTPAPATALAETTVPHRADSLAVDGISITHGPRSLVIVDPDGNPILVDQHV